MTESQRPTQIEPTRVIILAGHYSDATQDQIYEKTRDLAHTLNLFRPLPTIGYPNNERNRQKLPVIWPVKLVVSLQENQAKSFLVEGVDFTGYEIVIRPNGLCISDMRQHEEVRVNNPGWILMADSDIMGFDKFPSYNHEPLRTEPSRFCGDLAISFQFMTKKLKPNPRLWGWSTTEGDTGVPGANGFCNVIPEIKPFAPLQLVAIHKSSQGVYPKGWNNSEDIYRALSEFKTSGPDSIGRNRQFRLRAKYSKTHKDFKLNKEWQNHRREMEGEFGLGTVNKFLSGRTRHNARTELMR